MKIFLDPLKSDVESFLPESFFDSIVNKVPCSHEGCKGSIYYLLKQTQDGSALICNKCKRSVIVKLTEV